MIFAPTIFIESSLTITSNKSTKEEDKVISIARSTTPPFLYRFYHLDKRKTKINWKVLMIRYSAKPCFGNNKTIEMIDYIRFTKLVNFLLQTFDVLIINKKFVYYCFDNFFKIPNGATPDNETKRMKTPAFCLFLFSNIEYLKKLYQPRGNKIKKLEFFYKSWKLKNCDNWQFWSFR